MTDDELQKFLKTGQEQLRTALTTGAYEELPSIIDAREPYLVELSKRAQTNDSVKLWAQAYMDEDKAILEKTKAAQSEVLNKLKETRRNKNVQVAYINIDK